MAKNESTLLWKTMEYATSIFRENFTWSFLGSKPLTEAMKRICGIKQGEFAAKHVTGNML